MISDRIAVSPHLTVGTPCDSAIQIKLARNHRLREIPFADKIRHYVNVANGFWIEQKDRIAQARFLLPERALDICKNFPPPNLRRMRQRRRTRIRVQGR